jgi:DnaK suppressor protein
MEPETLQQYRERLLAQQQQIEQRVFRLETDLHEMESERDIERTDHIQEEAVNDPMIALDERSRRLLAEIQAALARIDDGTYGDCDVCGEPINPARLDALPMAHRCVRCQTELEEAAEHTRRER